MSINFIKIIFPIILGLSLLLFLSGCPDSPEAFDYQFNLPFEISPASDTLKIGYTLWLTASFVDELVDVKSNKVLAFVSENLYSTEKVVG